MQVSKQAIKDQMSINRLDYGQKTKQNANRQVSHSQACKQESKSTTAEME